MLVPAAVDDNLTHSTLAESAIFPLPTFTDISLSDGFSFRFDASKGETTARRFVLFLRPSFSSGGCGSPLLTLISWRLSCSSFHIVLFSSDDKWFFFCITLQNSEILRRKMARRLNNRCAGNVSEIAFAIEKCISYLLIYLYVYVLVGVLN